MTLKDLKSFDKESLLGSLGLESKPSTMSYVLGTFGVFGLGVLVGAGAALLLTPKNGNEIRRELRTRFNSVAGQAGQDGAQIEGSIS